MAKKRLIIRLSEDEREIFERLRGRDSLSNCIVKMALEQYAFLTKKANGEFARRDVAPPVANVRHGTFSGRNAVDGDAYLDRSSSQER